MHVEDDKGKSAKQRRCHAAWAAEFGWDGVC